MCPIGASQPSIPPSTRAVDPPGSPKTSLPPTARETARMMACTPRMARSIEVLRQPGLTPAQQDARMGLADRLADFRYALENDGDIRRAGKELLDAMEQADFADRRTVGQWS